MYHISTIILGNPRYQSDDQMSLDLVVTFEKPVVVEDIALKLTSEQGSIIFNPRPLDAQDVRDSDSPTSPQTKATHLLFSLQDLNCGQNYHYTLNSADDIAFFVQPGVGEKTGHVLTPQMFTTPPKPGQTQHVHLIASADQEGMDLIHHISIDDKLAKLLKLGLDHRELTTKIYQEIAKRHPHLFIQMGDIFHGENLIVQGQVKTLEEFRKHLADDFHDTARDSLASTIALRALDDHDMGCNAVDANTYKNESWPFENAINAFNEFWPVPTLAEDHHRGLYYKVTYGDLDIWILHNRLYTDKSSNLGQAQSEWLQKTLKASTAKAKIIISPLPFVLGKSPDEDYRGHPEEFDELLTLFAKNDVTAIFTADSHNYSRADIHIKLEDKEVIIPQFLVGILGGRPQAVSKEERKLFPQTLLPSEVSDKYAHTNVQSYYTPLDKPGSGIISLPGKKKHRAYDGQGWVGERKSKNQYGFVDVDFDFEQGKMHLSLFAMRSKPTKTKSKVIQDEAEYPLKPKTVKYS